jgi:integrase
MEAEQRTAKEEAARQAQERARLEEELAFEKVATLWLAHYEHEKDRRASSVRMAKMVVNNHLTPKLKGKPMPHIGRAELKPIFDAIPAQQRGMRRAVYAYASVLFGWAVERGDMADNPLEGMAKPEAPKARDRVLGDDELASVWAATMKLDDPFGAFFRLVIITGQRRSEVAAINWAELDRATATWTIPADRAKNGVAHIVPLSPVAIDELDRLARVDSEDEEEPDEIVWPKIGFVLTTTGRTPISGFAKAKNALDSAVAKAREDRTLAAWRVHDLRRTMESCQRRKGRHRRNLSASRLERGKAVGARCVGSARCRYHRCNREKKHCGV